MFMLPFLSMDLFSAVVASYLLHIQMHIALFVCALEILPTHKLDILLTSSLQNQLALYLGFQVKGFSFV